MDARANLSDAIASVEDLLGLRSPRDYTVASFPDDEFVDATHGGMLDIDRRMFFFGNEAEPHFLYHEAAHWVLMNNGLFFTGKDAFPIYGRALDETLAELCANTLEGKTNLQAAANISDARKAALDPLLLKRGFEQQAALYLLGARAQGRSDDPIVLFTAAHIFILPVVAYMTVKAMELEETFRRDRSKMAGSYKEFAALWEEHGNWIAERGVASALGERSGMTLFAKGCHPRKILDEIKEERRLLGPMQLYWSVIVPKL